MDKHDFDEMVRAADTLDARIQRERASIEQHGVLDGEERLAAREAALEIAKLKEQIRHFGEADADQRATDAADVAALRTQLTHWSAQVDRGFKSRGGASGDA